MSQNASPFQTTQPYTPLHLKVDIGKLPGVMLIFETFAAFAAAVAVEQSNVATGAPIWANGQRISAAESSVYRTWDTVALHARKCHFGQGLTYTLATDASQILTTSGMPASATGSDGYGAVDWPGGVFYVKAAGQWSVALTLTPLSTAQLLVVQQMIATALATPGAFTATAGTPTTTTIPVTVTPPPGVGPFTYTYSSRLTGHSGGFFAAASNISALNYTFTGLTPNNAYDIQVTPYSGTVAGPATTISTIITAGAPSYPAFASPTAYNSTPTVGTVLSFTPGIVTGTPTPTVSYQVFLATDISGTGAVAAASVNTPYTPVSADVGKWAIARITATNSVSTATDSRASRMVVTAPGG